jgi:hypothetical protein
MEKCFLRSGFGGSQELLDLAPHLLDRIEIGAVGRQKPHPCSDTVEPSAHNNPTVIDVHA